ncbi:12572_t:CDS:2 [Dentiscutata heterogama]|uniref:12572_t:CDS:1 n=1 Tax=Dentiscutata heterogama TaxID=1316150 RepID=A0ACA9KLP1_9GLOM|nr:12572_t:CDS:2 [Dentiscutata heterogama]
MDYSTVLKSLAKEVGISIPSIPNVRRCGKCGEPCVLGCCKPETQLNANTPFDYIRWIPFEEFTNIEYIARGGFGSVCSAYSENWGNVALKFLYNSENLLKELRAYRHCKRSFGIIDCYGVSRDTKTGNNVMVTRYAKQGSLRHYLSNYFTDLTWDEKIVLFNRIAKALKGIHDARLVHSNFHSGKILIHEKLVFITGLEMCHPVYETKGWNSYHYGVLPYVAPEVLRGELMIINICQGLRPPIISGTPKGYAVAMLRCWNSNPSKRPTIDELLNMLNKWRYLSSEKEPIQGPNTKKVNTGHVTVHPQAFYTSRMLHYLSLLEPQNFDGHNALFDSATGEIDIIDYKEPSDMSLLTLDELSSDKGKEKTQEDRRSRVTRKQSITKNMITSKTYKIDKEMIDKIRADRRKLSRYRWNFLNDLATINGNFATNIFPEL